MFHACMMATLRRRRKQLHHLDPQVSLGETGSTARKANVLHVLMIS